jgi:hypothetical protein
MFSRFLYLREAVARLRYYRRRDGKELFYLSFDGKLMAVDVAGGREFKVGTPKPLFQASNQHSESNGHE